MNSRYCIAGYFVFWMVGCQSSSQAPVLGDLSIIPIPTSIQNKEGFFVIDQHTWMQADSFPEATFDPYKVFDEVFFRKSGYGIPRLNDPHPKKNPNHLILIIKSPRKENDEAYRISVKPFGIIISASTGQGLFYAFQTLRQIMRLDALADAGDMQRSWAVPVVDIIDQPVFPYRGLHLDVCRHFMPVDFVKKYIDLLAYYKMNRFHWHLTEDQGWRIEIKKYPKLQEVAAWRDETLIGHYRDKPHQFDGIRHGGFYTHAEIKDVVAYAADRGVTIIPEIEMPGHALAALAAYPEFACTPGPFQVATKWGVFEDVFCPYESTFTFLQDVLDEVMELFPSTYIHIGGDECPKIRWKESAYCQDLIRKEGLKDEYELQSYFIRRIEKYLNQKGRNIIGWDEILEGGLAPNATVMSWRGMKGGIEAAKAGHDVIMTPGSHCYFDYYQAEPEEEPLAIGGMITLEKVYSFNPVPEALTPEEAKHILGAQGNVWTEYIPGPDQVEYMAYPRAMALAEVLWTPASQRNWREFIRRLNGHLDRLDGMEVNYARHLKDPTVEVRTGREGLKLVFKTDLPRQTVFFTRDTSLHIWDAAMSQDTILITEAGPVFYKSDYSRIKRLTYMPSKATGAAIQCQPPPDDRYPGHQGVITLTDGLRGREIFNGRDWCGWEGIPVTIDIDLGEEAAVDSLTIGMLSSPGSWIYLPESIDIQNVTVGSPSVGLGTWVGKDQVQGRQDISFNLKGTNLRYIRIRINPMEQIPPDMPGASHRAWTFIDEISVY